MKKVLKYARGMANYAEESFKTQRPRVPVLFITGFMDEARVWLRTINKIFSAGFKFSKIFNSMKVQIVLFGVLSVFWSIRVVFFSDWFTRCNVIITIIYAPIFGTMFGVFFAIITMLLFYYPVCLFVSAMGWLVGTILGTPIAFGWDYAFWSLFCRVKINSPWKNSLFQT